MLEQQLVTTKLSLEEPFTNIDFDPFGPWCYTTDPDARWEYL